MFMKIYTQKNVIPGLRLEKRALDDPWEGSTWINFAGYVPLASQNP